MNTSLVLNSLIFVISVLGVLLVFLINPVLIWVSSIIKGKKPVKTASIHPSISFISVVRNAEDLIVKKIKNSLSLNYPSEDYEIIFFSDGSTDRTEERVKPYVDKKVRLLSSATHEGKNNGMNKAVQYCSGDILIFSDIDAMLGKDTLLKLIKYFADPEVGGVGGKQTIYDDKQDLEKAQRNYKELDTSIKHLESQIGSISSNDGKLYAIRRELFKPIPPAVMDDIYVCLSVVKEGYRFFFEPEAKAFTKAPSRNIKHEILRRRRNISTSLRCVLLMKEMLNPLRYGYFSIRLIINKILRRMLPFFLILILFSSITLSSYNYFIKVFLYLQLGFYVLALSYWIVLRHIPQLKAINRIPSLAFYFCLGNYGMLLGVFDFLRGKKIIKWEPLKAK